MWTSKWYVGSLKAKLEWEAQEQAREAAGGAQTSTMPEEEHFVAYVPLPSDQEMEQQILKLKKQSLLEKYTSEAIQRQQEDAKLLLNKQ